MDFYRAMAGLFILVCLVGCATQRAELSPQTITTSPAPQSSQAARTPQALGAPDLLYITNREPTVASGNRLSYGAKRAIFLSFGSVSILPKGNSSAGTSEFRVDAVSETGRFRQRLTAS